MTNINYLENKDNKNLKAKIFGDKKFIFLMFSLFLPAALQQFITTAVTYVDTFFIAGFAPSNFYVGDQILTIENPGSIAKTSVGIATSIFNFPYMVVVGVVTGVGIVTSQYFGAQDKNRLQQTIIYKILFGIVLILPFIIVMTSIPEQIISISRNVYNYEIASEDYFINKLSRTYLWWSAHTLIIILITFTFSCSFREISKAKIPLIASIVSMTTNIIMDPLLIIFETNIDFAVRNIALATMASRFIELFVMLGYIIIKKDHYLLITKIKFDFNTFKVSIKNSWLAILNDALYGFATLFLVICLLVYNSKTHDAFTSVSVIIQFANVIFPGMAASCSVLIGSELGKNNIEQAKKNSVILIVWGLIITAFLSLVLLILSFFINPILSPPPPLDSVLYSEWLVNQKLAQQAEWVMMPVIFSQGLFSILYYSIKAGGSKFIFLTDGLVMSIWCIVLGSLIYTKTINIGNMPPLTLFFIVELNQIVKALFCLFLYKYTKWAISISNQ